MEEEIVRQIIRDELSNILKIDRYAFDRNIQILNARNIQLGRTNGTMIGTEGYVDSDDEGQKLGFYGVTPVIQPATVADPSGGANADDQSRTAINALTDRLQELGLIR